MAGLDEGYGYWAGRIARALTPKHRDRLECLANVIATGVGPQRVDGERTGDPALKVFVESKLPERALERSNIVPREIETDDGTTIQTDVVGIGGRFRPTSSTDGHPGTGAPVRRERVRPVPGGVSISSPAGGSASASALVSHDDGSRVLTSRHAVSSGLNSSHGNSVYQPSQAHATSPERIGRIAALAEWETGTRPNLADAALVSVSSSTTSGRYLGHAAAIGTAPPDLDRRCVQFAYPTGIAGGEILATDVRTTVEYDFASLTYQDVIVTDLPGSPGSSGAAVGQISRQDNTLELIGMHIAGSAGAGVVVPWSNLEEEFGDLEPVQK